VHCIAFRADATSQIGMGHFMRCLTLASELKQRGAHIRFVSRGLPLHLRDSLAEMGMEFVALDSDGAQFSADDLAHANWLGVSQAQDAQSAVQALSGRLWDWIVVDHYALDVRWENALRGTAKKIMVIDDIADREHDCDLLLDQNFYADMQTRYTGKVPSYCKLLLGPNYALLRDEFKKLREQVKPRTGVVNRVLVFLGGVDADNYTGQAIEALSGIDARDIHVDVVIGAQHPCRIRVEEACAERGYHCHVQTNRMAELMATADLAIGAGGSASWERCCLGVPALLVALAKNQIEIAQALDAFGACVYIGTKETVNSLTFQNEIENLLGNQGRLEMISRQAFSLVDGVGVNRVCQELNC
jgi:UDP-2,4-diacetamido-2,4,6-trideoxy-beta-L-altropyranose hydrolase